MATKEDRTLIIMQRWVDGEITTEQADRELEVTGVELPKTNVKLSPGNEG